MVTLASIVPRPKRLFTALSLKDSFFYVGVYQSHRSFLKLIADVITSLWSSPWVCTKCMAVVAAYLMKVEVPVYPYLGEWLFWDLSRQQIIVAIEKIRSLFQSLELLINKDKSVSPSPENQIHRNSSQLNHSNHILPQARISGDMGPIQRLQAYSCTTVRNCLKLRGHMTACSYKNQ